MAWKWHRVFSAIKSWQILGDFWGEKTHAEQSTEYQTMVYAIHAADTFKIVVISVRSMCPKSHNSNQYNLPQ